MQAMDWGDARVTRIEWARLEGQRPRKAGCNARLGEHGQVVRPVIARVTASDGLTGWSWARLRRDEAAALLGTPLNGAWLPTGGVRSPLRPIEYPLLDLAGRRAGVPVWALLSDAASAPVVTTYDTSLYMDDLHLDDDGAAAALIADEAREGLARGHRHFKIKVGRGAMHMPLEAGMRRDIAVVKAVAEAAREASGAAARIMVDVNNGYNLSLTQRFLDETADVALFWLEEPFHEDARVLEALKRWMSDRGLATLLADGEGDASPHLLDMARDGLVDVVQYDMYGYGPSRWLELGPCLAPWGAGAAPHHYGEPYGNYACGHLAPAIEGFQMVEWDHADVPGLDASAYIVRDGSLTLPELPGFGVGLDEATFTRAVAETGFDVSL